MALSTTTLTAQRRYATGTLATTVAIVTVKGWRNVNVTASGDVVHFAIVGNDATLAALAAGDAAPSGYSTNGIAAGGGRTITGPGVGTWTFLIWGASTSSVADLEGAA